MKKTAIKYIIGGAVVLAGIICIGIAAAVGGTQAFEDGFYINGFGSGAVFSGEDTTQIMETTDIKNLSINIDAADLFITNGDVDKITVNTSNLRADRFSCAAQGKTLNIRYDTDYWFFSLSFCSNAAIQIVLPENIDMDSVVIEHGVGKADIKGLKAKTITMNSGVGETYINGITADSLDCRSGVGETTVINAFANDLVIKSGVGAFSFSGTLNGNGTVKSGIGEVRMSLLGNADKYGFEVKSGIGEVTVNGGRVSGVSSGEYTIDVNSGIGAVNITIK